MASTQITSQDLRRREENQTMSDIKVYFFNLSIGPSETLCPVDMTVKVPDGAEKTEGENDLFNQLTVFPTGKVLGTIPVADEDNPGEVFVSPSDDVNIKVYSWL
eukprot:TRINITY_DN40091_c0_g1_i1.p1 TRINITY_DN40091_c0_g1~~TRINITY_DN40091_c0_g1_i1.p1  ORF type:complete len:104 (-),score=11.14 TRINITY_DN40091_c0_g1_i1:180-491(-)